MKPTRFNAAFRRWFGRSKVVDTHGEPLVVYHGTSNKSREGFSDKPKKASFDYEGPKFFSAGKGQAAVYGPTIIPVYLSVKNPLVVTKEMGGYSYFSGEHGAGIYDDYEYLMKEGYDGAVWSEPGHPDVWVVFSPTQIKSVHNSGTWSRTDPRIRNPVEEEQYRMWWVSPDRRIYECYGAGHYDWIARRGMNLPEAISAGWLRVGRIPGGTIYVDFDTEDATAWQRVRDALFDLGLTSGPVEFQNTILEKVWPHERIEDFLAGGDGR